MNSKSDNMLSQDQRDDYSLIRAFHNGEKSAFDALVIRHKDRILNLCIRFLGDYQEAEDTAQDVFVKAYTALNRFRFESSFFTWLYRIGINTCKNKVKSLDFRNRKADTRVDNQGDDREGHLAGHPEESGPQVQLENKERLKMLQRAIDSLPLDQKSIVILRDVQGLSYEEIAEITDFKLGTIKSRLSRARNSLREKLGDIL